MDSPYSWQSWQSSLGTSQSERCLSSIVLIPSPKLPFTLPIHIIYSGPGKQAKLGAVKKRRNLICKLIRNNIGMEPEPSKVKQRERNLKWSKGAIRSPMMTVAPTYSYFLDCR